MAEKPECEICGNDVEPNTPQVWGVEDGREYFMHQLCHDGLKELADEIRQKLGADDQKTRN